jgi:predicted RND superfamily exporter protein
MSMDREAALARSIEIRDALADDFESISAAGDILPPLARQERNIAVLASLDADRIVRDFRKIASEKGFDLSGFALFSAGLKNMLQNREPITFKDIGPVREALDRLLINEDGRWTVVVTGNLKQDASRQVLAGFSHTGPSFIRQELLSILVKDTVIIGLISLTLVNIILYLDFRNVYHVLFCQAPVVVSIFCTLGIMGITGISLNFMDAIVFVLLFGIGTDYTVHLLHRYLADRNVGTTFLQTGKAVLVAGLTTVAGIGSLGTSSYKGLATMGQVAAAGTTLCVVFSLTLVPALLGLREGRSSR